MSCCVHNVNQRSTHVVTLQAKDNQMTRSSFRLGDWIVGWLSRAFFNYCTIDVSLSAWQAQRVCNMKKSLKPHAQWMRHSGADISARSVCAFSVQLLLQQQYLLFNHQVKSKTKEKMLEAIRKYHIENRQTDLDDAVEAVQIRVRVILRYWSTLPIIILLSFTQFH